MINKCLDKYLEKVSASLQAKNNKTYWQMLKRLYGGGEEALQSMSKSRDYGIYHGTKSQESLDSIVSEGLKVVDDGRHAYGKGAYVGSRVNASRYGRNLASIKLPSEMTTAKLKYPPIAEVNKVTEVKPYILKKDLTNDDHKLLSAAAYRYENVLTGRTKPVPDRLINRYESKWGTAGSSHSAGDTAREYNLALADGYDKPYLLGHLRVYINNRVRNRTSQRFTLTPNSKAYGRGSDSMGNSVDILKNESNRDEMHFIKGVPSSMLNHASSVSPLPIKAVNRNPNIKVKPVSVEVPVITPIQHTDQPKVLINPVQAPTKESIIDNVENLRDTQKGYNLNEQQKSYNIDKPTKTNYAPHVAAGLAITGLGAYGVYKHRKEVNDNG